MLPQKSGDVAGLTPSQTSWGKSFATHLDLLLLASFSIKTLVRGLRFFMKLSCLLPLRSGWELAVQHNLSKTLWPFGQNLAVCVYLWSSGQRHKCAFLFFFFRSHLCKLHMFSWHCDYTYSIFITNFWKLLLSHKEYPSFWYPSFVFNCNPTEHRVHFSERWTPENKWFRSLVSNEKKNSIAEK